MKAQCLTFLFALHFGLPFVFAESNDFDFRRQYSSGNDILDEYREVQELYEDYRYADPKDRSTIHKEFIEKSRAWVKRSEADLRAKRDAETYREIHQMEADLNYWHHLEDSHRNRGRQNWDTSGYAPARTSMYNPATGVNEIYDAESGEWIKKGKPLPSVPRHRTAPPEYRGRYANKPVSDFVQIPDRNLDDYLSVPAEGAFVPPTPNPRPQPAVVTQNPHTVPLQGTTLTTSPAVTHSAQPAPASYGQTGQSSTSPLGRSTQRGYSHPHGPSTGVPNYVDPIYLESLVQDSLSCNGIPISPYVVATTSQCLFDLRDGQIAATRYQQRAVNVALHQSVRPESFENAPIFAEVDFALVFFGSERLCRSGVPLFTNFAQIGLANPGERVFVSGFEKGQQYTRVENLTIDTLIGSEVRPEEPVFYLVKSDKLSQFYSGAGLFSTRGELLGVLRGCNSKNECGFVAMTSFYQFDTLSRVRRSPISPYLDGIRFGPSVR